jgi:hypothetical protein
MQTSLTFKISTANNDIICVLGEANKLAAPSLAVVKEFPIG